MQLSLRKKKKKVNMYLPKLILIRVKHYFVELWVGFGEDPVLFIYIYIYL
jgi:hypothetical protein